MSVLLYSSADILKRLPKPWENFEHNYKVLKEEKKKLCLNFSTKAINQS